MNKKDYDVKLGKSWEIDFNLKRIKELALEIANNEKVDVTPTAQAEIITKMIDKIKSLL